MRFVKRISLFFIYPLTMFSIGFFSNMVIMDYFYPGNLQQTKTPIKQIAQKEILTDPKEITEGIVPQKELGVTKVNSQIVTANTKYIVQTVQKSTGEIVSEERQTPEMYIGLSRNRLVQKIEDYNNSPPLTEQQVGFVYAELVSFSPEKIVIRKSYETVKPPEEKGFFLLLENNYVVVYEESLQYIYMHTGIQAEELPEGLQQEIIRMKYIENEKELFNFLESFSS